MPDVTMPILDITNEEDIFNDAKKNLRILNKKIIISLNYK
jgi:hypothetical protein